MLGDKIGSETGKITGRRVLPNPGGGPKMEISFEANSTILGVNGKTVASYWSTLRADGHLYGEGQAVIMGEGGESATWVGQGVGTFRKDGGVGFRGAVYLQSSTAKWSKLNGVAAVYEYDVDAEGNTHTEIWEWK